MMVSIADATLASPQLAQTYAEAVRSIVSIADATLASPQPPDRLWLSVKGYRFQSQTRRLPPRNPASGSNVGLVYRTFQSQTRRLPPRNPSSHLRLDR